jgi:glycosyltransferase involved in cell wall biosynthesis
MPEPNPITIALLTGGGDKPYAFGYANAFIDAGIAFEFLGSDELRSPMLENHPLVTFRNMRGDQSEGAPLSTKVVRILRYYGRLLKYAVTAKPRIFHILWNNKFEWFDRTILMLFYRLCGRKVVLTAHNVNIRERDGTDSFMNRCTLRLQYALASAIFVHTEMMSSDLRNKFGVPSAKIKVIPFPINSTPPTTDLTCGEARAKVGLGERERVLLVYGQIAPYKGVEYLVDSLSLLQKQGWPCRLLIAGRVKKGAEAYWENLEQTIQRLRLDTAVLARIEFIPDEETEVYFKAADALVLPYKAIFQSGVLFLSYNYGLPVLVSDAGSLKDSIVEGETGLVFRAGDVDALAAVIQRYFESPLYQDLPNRRPKIRQFALEHYSWSRVISVTLRVYSEVMGAEKERSLQTS